MPAWSPRARAAWLGAAVLLLGACSTVKRAPPPSTDMEEAGLRAAVRALTADEFDGRRPGTPGEDKTVAFLTERLRKLGLKPGNGESYVQQVPMVESTAHEATLRVAGKGAAIDLVYAKDMVIWSPGEAQAASVQGSELVFVGYGIVAPEYRWDDYAQADVRGKTVLVMAGDPGGSDPRLFRGNAQTLYGRMNYKLEEAARHGAAGVLVIHGAAAGASWEALLEETTGGHLSLALPGAPAGLAIEGWVSEAAARNVFAEAGMRLETLVAACARPSFRAISTGLRVDAALHSTVRKFVSANVLAMVPGTSRKHEYVLYTAHWDHLGRQAPDSGGAVLPGAVDDAAGVAGLLMLAQSFSRTRPAAERSVVFAVFTGATAGLLGSTYYLEHPLYPLRDTAAVLDLDLPHIGGPTRDVTIMGYGNSELEEFARDAALLQGREVRPDPLPEQGFYYRSDAWNFARAGIPALYARAGLDDSARGAAWGRARFEDYLAQRYHRTGDAYSPDWDLRGTLDDLRLYYQVGGRVARSGRFPLFYPNSEFRHAGGGSDLPGT